MFDLLQNTDFECLNCRKPKKQIQFDVAYGNSYIKQYIPRYNSRHGGNFTTLNFTTLNFTTLITETGQLTSRIGAHKDDILHMGTVGHPGFVGGALGGVGLVVGGNGRTPFPVDPDTTGSLLYRGVRDVHGSHRRPDGKNNSQVVSFSFSGLQNFETQIHDVSSDKLTSRTTAVLVYTKVTNISFRGRVGVGGVKRIG